MRISIITLPTNHYLAGGGRLNDFAEWEVGKPLMDSDFFVGASDKFRRELRKQLKRLISGVASQA
jgi:hypothetical protein